MAETPKKAAVPVKQVQKQNEGNKRKAKEAQKDSFKKDKLQEKAVPAAAVAAVV